MYSPRTGCASIDGKLAFFTTLLTRRVPATHGRLAGALCCKSCFDKCKTGAKPGFRADEYPVPDVAEDETQMGKRKEPEKTGGAPFEQRSRRKYDDQNATGDDGFAE